MEQFFRFRKLFHLSGTIPLLSFEAIPVFAAVTAQADGMAFGTVTGACFSFGDSSSSA
jgi:hypothetical protein